MKISTAIVGLGPWGRNLIRTANNSMDVKYGVSLGDSEGKNWLNQHYSNIKWTNSLQSILPEVDSVIIASPDTLHYEQAIMCMRAKKHVLVEKPPARSDLEASILSEVSKCNEVALMGSWTFLYHPVYSYIRRTLTPTSVECVWYKQLHNSNILWSLACHDIALSLDLFGEPAQILINPKVSSNYIQIMLKSTKGNSTSIVVHRGSFTPKKTVTLVCNNISYVWTEDKLYKYGGDQPIYTQVEGDSALNQEILHFIHTIQNKEWRETERNKIVSTTRTLARIASLIP